MCSRSGDAHQACVSAVHGANKHGACSRQQPASANALAPGGRTTVGSVIPLHLSHGRHGEDSASGTKEAGSSQTSSWRSSCSAENIHQYQSAPSLRSWRWGGAWHPCCGRLSHDHRGQSGALASIHHGFKTGPGIHPADLLGSRVIQQQAGAATGLPAPGTRRCCPARFLSDSVQPGQ